MASDADRYEVYYTEKLWALLPEVYRAEDRVDASGEAPGPLRELVARVGAQAAVLRRSIDRLWEDQSIETCDDWVVAYIGDLLATNLVDGLDARGQRLDVAKTIYYRRRKGTVALLEELAHDITGWDARVVEMFRRLGRTRSMLDPAVGPSSSLARRHAERLVGPRTRTPAGGLADLRDVAGALAAHGAFDEFAHTVDVRRGDGARGLHNIPRLAFYLWRLYSIPALRVTPVQDAACPNRFTLDPTGRRAPLFAPQQLDRYGDAWTSPDEASVPGPLDRATLHRALSTLYKEVVANSPASATWAVSIVPAAIAPYSVRRSRVTAEPARFRTDASGDAPDYFIDPARGELYQSDRARGEDGEVLVSFHHGFASRIGAGGYDWRARGRSSPRPSPMLTVSGGGAAFAATATTGTLRIADSQTYTQAPALEVTGHLVVVADHRQRPLVRTPPATVWHFQGSPGARLRVEGLFVSGADIALDGSFEEVVFDACTLDPGTMDGAGLGHAADGQPLGPSTLRVNGQVKRLVITRCVLGPLMMTSGGSLEEVAIEDSVVQGIGGAAAITLATGDLRLDRVTVLGDARVRRLSANASILHGAVVVDDDQHGCLRFSAWTSGSVLPRKFQCAELQPSAPIFATVAFGDPAYATLSPRAGAAVTAGAEDGSEMGAFSGERRAVRERSLLIKLAEYMPVGLSPVIVYVT